MLARFGFVLTALLLMAGPVPALELDLSRMLGPEQAREWRAVGRVNFADGRSTAMCTGTLIAPSLVLTAAHCVIGAQTGELYAPANVNFVAGWRLGTAAARRRAVSISIHPGYRPAEPVSLASIATDLAIIRLETPIPETEIAAFALAETAVPTGPVTLVSYRRDRPDALSLQQGCAYAGRDGAVLVLDCDTTFGVSGAPVFDGTGSERRIVGVISAMSRAGPTPRAFAVSVAAALPELLLALR